MDFNKKTERKIITIQKVPVNVIAPFTEGHILTEKEAAVLNQTLAENLRNNFASRVKVAIKDAGDDATKVDEKALQAEFDTYMSEYEFGVRRTGTARVVDPIERKAMELARAKVREYIKAKGYKISDVPASSITQYAKDLLEKTPALMDEAKRQIEATQNVALDVMDLGGLLGGDEETAE